MINGTPTDGLGHDAILEQFTTKKVLHMVVLRVREKADKVSGIEEDFNPDTDQLDEPG